MTKIFNFNKFNHSENPVNSVNSGSDNGLNNFTQEVT